MPNIRAVVFDLDGLMFNTEDIFNHAGREQLKRRGKEMTDELLSRMMGRRAGEAFAIMIEMHELSESADELQAECKEIFYGLLDAHLAPMPGLFELLACIELHELPTGVATSSNRKYLDNILARFELTHRFQITFASEDVRHGKPHPEIYLKAAEHFGIAPAEMLVLEDSEAGSRAAAAAGAHVVSVPHEHSRSHDFSVSNYVVESLHDPYVLDLIGGTI